MKTGELLNLKVANGVAYIWSAEDWFTLRIEHRIIGYFDGALREGETLSHRLPLRLSKVETQFLIKNGIGQAVQAPKLNSSEPIVSQESFSELRKRRLEVQLDDFKNRRRVELEYVVDKIIQGKKSKGKSIIPDRNAVMQDELAKIKSVPFELIQIDMADPWTDIKDYIPIDFPMPSSPLDILRLRVFEDFHNTRKCFVTSGIKFGCDFLAYPGDPIEYHSEYMIICKEKDHKVSEGFLISQKRLARTVKKKLIVASIDDNVDILKYQEF